MAVEKLSVEEIMAILPETPRRIAASTLGLTPIELRASPEAGAWSVNDVLGGNTLRILAEDRPTWKGISPRRGSSGRPSRSSGRSEPTC